MQLPAAVFIIQVLDDRRGGRQDEAGVLTAEAKAALRLATNQALAMSPQPAAERPPLKDVREKYRTSKDYARALGWALKHGFNSDDIKPAYVDAYPQELDCHRVALYDGDFGVARGDSGVFAWARLPFVRRGHGDGRGEAGGALGGSAVDMARWRSRLCGLPRFAGPLL